MSLLMRDSIDPGAIPLQGLAAAAGYGDGEFEWPPAGWARFAPPIVSLSIVVSAADVGDILDVERFDATPADAPGWADRFNRPGRRQPTLYHSRELRDQVLAAMAGRPYDWWAATLDGTQFVEGAVAVQYAGADRTGGAYDESVILDPSWVGGEDVATIDDVMAKVANIEGVLIDPSGTHADTWLRQFLEGEKAGLPAAVATAVVAQLPAGSSTFTVDQVAAAVVASFASKLAA